MKTCILSLLAETSIHSGAGQSSGIVDLPVAREAATDYPVIPGSSLKGALLGFAGDLGPDGSDRMSNADRYRIFGTAESEENQSGAGALLVSDARLLLLPVRSLQSAYKWVTCPHLIERFGRDTKRAGHTNNAPTVDIAEGHYLGIGEQLLLLEERQFERNDGLPDGLVASIESLVPHPETTRVRLAKQLVVLNDNDFAWFARYGLAIQARNALHPDTKTSKNLWYEEAIPADALFYAVLAERAENALTSVMKLFNGHSCIQVGGNETVGMGWFSVTFSDGKGGAA